MNDQQIIDTVQQIGKLLIRKWQGTLTEDEQAVLNEWLEKRDLADRQFYEDMINSNNVEEALQHLYQVDEEAALADVRNKLQFPAMAVIPVAPAITMKGWRRYYKYVAAAAITGAVVTATVWLTGRNKKADDLVNVPAEQHYKQDVEPGGNKAVLTLADGRIITLDEAQNGVLTKEGNTAINKKDGAVVYQSPTDNAQPTTVVDYNTLSTPRGGQYQLVLPDGSKVWLNAASSITYPTAFTGNERKVELTGEGYFEVSKNAAKPFHVQVNNMDVEVLGTHFNINSYIDEPAIRTTLLEGSVKVVNRSRLIAGAIAKNSVVLTPGKQAAFIADSRFTIADADVEQVIAWKNGLFQFQDASIETIMRQVARWYNVDVEYKSKIDKQFIGKIPRRVPVSTVLNILESTGWVHFTIDGKKIIVAP